MDDSPAAQDEIALAAQETRSANDRIGAKARRLHFTARVPFLCECLDPRCRELVLLAPDAFDALRDAGGAARAHGHAAAPSDGALDELEQTG